MRSFIRSASVALVVAVAMGASPAAAQVCMRGTLGDGFTRWETTSYAAVSFVEALAPDMEVERIDGGALVTSDGRVIGLAPSAGHAGPTTLVVRQTTTDDAQLRPPLVRGPQRLSVSASDHGLLAFTPEAGSSIESYVGYHASAGFDERQRETLDTVCGASDRAIRIYVDAASRDAVRGRLVRGSDRGETLLWLAAAVLVLSLILGVVAYRRLTGRAQVEYADAMLEKRFREIDRGVGPSG